MALQARMLKRLCDELKAGDAIASMGYPDIVSPEKDVAELLGDRISGLKYREDAQRICGRHGMALQQIPDAESFFECLGASLDVYDIVEERGGEIVVDLNYPIPAQACGQYDFVLDVGTLEHCFNAPQALVNMAALLKVGGMVLHENPFNWGNHGFWNLNPTLFHDFYTDNGFEIVECKLLPRGAKEIWDVPLTKRFKYTDQEANIFTIAKRVEVKEMAFPIQTKYRR